jgi:hypothetical protein
LVLRDHGNEIIPGLAELYATVSKARPEKKKAYHDPIHRMLDNILEHGINDDGFLVERYNPRTGEVLKDTQVVQYPFEVTLPLGEDGSAPTIQLC